MSQNFNQIVIRKNQEPKKIWCGVFFVWPSVSDSRFWLP